MQSPAWHSPVTLSQLGWGDGASQSKAPPLSLQPRRHTGRFTATTKHLPTVCKAENSKGICLKAKPNSGLH